MFWFSIGLLISVTLTIDMHRTKAQIRKKGHPISGYANYNKELELLTLIIENSSDENERLKYQKLLKRHKLSIPIGVLGALFMLVGILEFS